MPKTRKQWVYSPPKPTKPTVPAAIKAELDAKAQALIAQHLKPAHIKPPPEDPQFNYLIDIWTKWYRGYFYFCGTYASPGPNAFSPTFEIRFARMEYVGNSRFNLAYMRHTEQWLELYQALSIDDCLASVRDEPFFFP
jgi:hypothetical protein